MAWETTSLLDCLIISKKFERGAMFSTTEQSGFALLGPVLDGMRIQSQSYVNQADAVERVAAPKSAKERAEGALAPNATQLSSTSALLGTDTSSNVARNMDKADEKDQDFGERLAGNWGLTNEDGNFDMSGVFDSECIPCGLRVDEAGLDAFFTEVGQGVVNGLSAYLNFWEELFKKQLSQLLDMLSLFNNTDPYIDLCALIKFFTEFMCVPDIAKVLSVLMALMRKQSFEFNGILDLVLQFVGPLLSPFLGNLLGVLEQFIWMIVKPIECIIDSIQALIAKFDYNILFTNIQTLDKHVDFGGPKKGAWLPGNEENEAKYRRADPRGDYVFRLDQPRLDDEEPKTPWVDGHIARRDTVEGERWAEFDFNMAGPVSTWVDEEYAENQAAVDAAERELVAVREAGAKVDGSDPDAIKAQRERERAAKDNLQSATDKRDMSAIGRVNATVDRGVAGMKSSLIMIIGFLREGVQAVEGFFDFIFDEFKKLMGEYVGGSGGLIGEIIKKNSLSQIINLIYSIYEALQKGAICEDPAEDIKVESWIPELSGMKLWTDEDGSIHIEGDADEIDAAVNAFVEAQGVEPPSEESGTSAAEKDKGGQPDTASQKLKSLIEFTGDPVLDSEIARVTEQLVTPVNVVFKCPLITTVAQTEQINQWIREVNT